jgi:hypothetical protein
MVLLKGDSMNDYSRNKQNAINFVFKIPDFQKNMTLINNFLENLDNDQLEGLKYFLKMTDLLFMEESVAGNFLCQTGVVFNQLNDSDIPIFISDIKNGKYDEYL